MLDGDNHRLRLKKMSFSLILFEIIIIKINSQDIFMYIFLLIKIDIN